MMKALALVVVALVLAPACSKCVDVPGQIDSQGHYQPAHRVCQ